MWRQKDVYVDKSWTEGLILVFIICVVLHALSALKCAYVYLGKCIEDPVLIVHELLW